MKPAPHFVSRSYTLVAQTDTPARSRVVAVRVTTLRKDPLASRGGPVP